MRMWSIVVGKAWRQEHKAAGHTSPTDRKQREMNAVAQHTLYCLVQDPACGMPLTTLRQAFPSSVKSLRKHTHSLT